MKRSILPILLLALLWVTVRGAVVVTYRGDLPNTFGLLPLPSNTRFDVNADGIADYRFLGDGNFVAGIQSFGSNRFISALATSQDIGGSVVPVSIGSSIGTDTTLLPGGWHHHSDNGGGSMFDLNYGPMPMQFADAYIGLEFAAADGIHYGWIQYVGYSHPEKGLGYYVPGGFIDSWAWETQPGLPIIAGAVPETSHTVLFGVGCILLLVKRHRDEEQNKSWMPTFHLPLNHSATPPSSAVASH